MRKCTLYIGGTPEEQTWMKENVIPELSKLEGIIITSSYGNDEIRGSALEYDAGTGCGYILARGVSDVALYANMLYTSLQKKSKPSRAAVSPSSS